MTILEANMRTELVGIALPPANVVWFNDDSKLFGAKCPYCEAIQICTYGGKRFWPCKRWSRSGLTENFTIEKDAFDIEKFKFVEALDLFIKAEFAQRFEASTLSTGPSPGVVSIEQNEKGQATVPDRDELDITQEVARLDIVSDGSSACEPVDHSRLVAAIDKIVASRMRESVHDRRLWSRQLLDPNEDSLSSSSSLSDLYAFRKTQDGILGNVQLVVPIAQYPSYGAQKVLAVLLYPLNESLVAAQSGWGHDFESRSSTEGAGEDGGKLLDGNRWTAVVTQLSAIVRHELPLMSGDAPGHDGSSYASHAEKQIIAFAVHKYIFERETQAVSMTDMEILVSKLPCEDCKVFINAVCKTYKLNIKVWVDERCDGSRVENNPAIKGKGGVICYPSEVKPVPDHRGLSTRYAPVRGRFMDDE
jgi:hypothetical protein